MASMGFRSIRALVALAALAGLVIGVWLVAGCEKDTPTGDPLSLLPAGEITGHTACKLGSSASLATLDCVSYRFTEVGVLLLKHENAAFNCCPDDLAAQVTVSNDTIRIVESEIVTMPCACLCLYDIDYRIEGLTPGAYTIVVVEPYTSEGDSLLAATIDFVAAPSGEFCAGRDHYPWLQNANPPEPRGRISSVIGCNPEITRSHGPTSDMSCAEFRYLYGDRLLIRHMNAGFNCCAHEIAADIMVENGAITIVEREDQSACDCSCLYFEIEYEIVNIPPGLYTVRFVEPYRNPDDEPLEFAVNLSTGPAYGVACAGRVHYPWTQERTESEDWQLLEAFGRDIVSYLAAAPCNGDADCRYIAFGAKPCGGPWRYLVYSARDIDEAYLVESRVSWYNAYNGVFNRRWNAISDCSIPPMPTPGCAGGRCVDVGIAR